MLDAPAILALAERCAPGVAPSTLLAIVRAESALNPLAIGVNGPPPGRRAKALTQAEATASARAHLAAGRDIDLGLGQINVRNLARLGLSIDEAFDPCRNLAAAAQVLREGYARGRAAYGPGQAALRVALSHYNTGDARRGFANGYVAKVLAQASPGAGAAPAPGPPAKPPSAPPAWDVFGRAAAVHARFVISPAGATP